MTVIPAEDVIEMPLDERGARRILRRARRSHQRRGEKRLMPRLSPRRISRELPDLESALPHLSGESVGLVPNLEDEEPEEWKVKIEPFDKKQIHPIGVDVRLGDEVWVSDTLMKISNPDDLKHLESAKKHKIRNKFTCLPDPRGRNVYYFLTHERIKHTPNIEYKVDSKSTTGRVGCMSHQVSNGDLFDGRIMIALQPYAFPIEVIPGKTSTSQVIFRFRGTPLMNQEEIKEAWKEEEATLSIDDTVLPLSQVLRPGGLEMTFYR